MMLPFKVDIDCFEGLTMDLLELRTLGTGTGPLKVQLGYLRHDYSRHRPHPMCSSNVNQTSELLAVVLKQANRMAFCSTMS